MIEEEKKDYCKEASDELFDAEKKFFDVLPKKDSNPSNEDLLKTITYLWNLVDKQSKYHFWKLSQDVSNAQSYCEHIGRKLLDDEWRLNAHQWRDKIHANDSDGPFNYPDPCCEVKKEQNEQSTS